MFHETAVDSASQHIPEYQQHLKFSEMENKKLNRKEMIDIFQRLPHKWVVA
jgi:hypothetical protein